MTKEEWYKLKKGSTVKGNAPKGVIRIVLKKTHKDSSITLIAAKSHTCTLWSGRTGYYVKGSTRRPIASATNRCLRLSDIKTLQYLHSMIILKL